MNLEQTYKTVVLKEMLEAELKELEIAKGIETMTR